MAMRAKTSFAGRSDQTKSPEEKPAVPREAITVQKKLEPGNLKPLTGAHDDVLSNVLCNQLLNAWYHPSYEETDKDNLKKAALCAMEGLQPVTEGEGLLAAQMVACHWSAMECYRRAMLSNQTFEGTQQYLHLANKLSRTYAFLMEALDKHRGKGQQKVTVEHVQCASWWPSYRWHRGGGGR